MRSLAGHTAADSLPTFRSVTRARGLDWLFCIRRDSEPDVFSIAGLDRACLRTAKMARVEAALLVAEGALTTRKLAALATLADPAEAKSLIEQLNAAYDRGGNAFRIERVASGYQLLTRPQFAFWLGKLHHREAELKLTPPAMETLTIIAYRQPITRADLELIRGVQCAEMLKMLMDRGLVRIGGEDESLGRPYLYETTRKFLETFGLRSLEELPMADELRRKAPPLSVESAA
jgi:segregation and condensation protein B